jgi:hypothetical protein
MANSKVGIATGIRRTPLGIGRSRNARFSLPIHSATTKSLSMSAWPECANLETGLGLAIFSNTKPQCSIRSLPLTAALRTLLTLAATRSRPQMSEPAPASCCSWKVSAPPGTRKTDRHHTRSNPVTDETIPCSWCPINIPSVTGTLSPAPNAFQTPFRMKCLSPGLLLSPGCLSERPPRHRHDLRDFRTSRAFQRAEPQYPKRSSRAR